MPTIDWTGIEPSAVFERFAEIARIPHGSGHEKAMGAYLMDFAASRELSARQDGVGNVIIDKPACANVSYPHPVIVQSHMDMVWAKEHGKEFDFATQPIPLRRDGDWLCADGTTLGADNGIGMAYALALLDGNEGGLPAIEAVFTVAEETGMDGALAIDAHALSGRILVNIDTEEDGVFCASCCGGQDAQIELPLVMVSAPASDVVWFRLGVSGLMGGHSGVEIHKGRGNSLRLLGRMLDNLIQRCRIDIAGIHGGVVRNAIPSEAWADIAVPRAASDTVAEQVGQWRGVFGEELRGAGEKPIVTLEPIEPRATVMTPGNARTVAFAMNIIPHGVEAMDYNMPGQTLVETSTNFAMIRQSGATIAFISSIRSTLESKRAMLSRRIELLAADMGGFFSAGSGYPGWIYDPDSHVREIFLQAYERLFGKKALVEGVHGGLECGVFSKKFREAGKTLDIISLGPDIRDAHTPKERVNIPSTRRIWRLLLAALRDIAREPA